MRTTVAELGKAAEVRRATTALAARARAERKGDLTLNEVAVLGRVATEGPITPGEVAAQLRMLPQSLTRVFAALERAGLLVRTPDPDDRRGALLAVTASGVAALRAEMRPRDRWLATAMATVCTDEELATLQAATVVMERLVAFGGGVAPAEP